MTPERYQQIDRVFQATLAVDPEKRAAYLDEACSGDETLRREVESLITSDEGGLSFIDEPAFEMAARVLASDEPALAPGDRIDRYVVVSLLGSGGMGEVYLAHDEKLDRKIALKLLPSHFTTNEERLRRFQQEARAVSALNYPNIITIHEIGQAENRNFIATEFVDGETLRQRMKRGELSLPESLDISIQVCSALAAAHQAGIVHRDIKPENIMLRRDGYVKVLDFGLAKLTEQDEPPTSPDSVEKVDVSSGLVMGTVRYMSPEQAQGLPLDQRTDLFSLGVVLYEMLTGHAPFDGQGGREFVKSILADEPPRLTDYLADAPEELQRIVSKSLSKDKTARYQNAEEFLIDLKALQQRRTSILTYVTAQIQQHKAASSLALTALVLTAAVMGFGIYKFFKPRRAHFQNLNITKLTNFDDAWWPSISPDGKYVAYVKGTSTTGPDKNSLWLKTVGTTDEVAIVPAVEDRIWSTRFLPDGARIGYQTRGGAFVIPASGGSPTKLTQKGISFSPDGKRVAHLDNRLPEGRTVLVVGKSDGTDLRDITIRQAPNYYWTAIRPSWSADGKLIACVGQNGSESFPHVFVIDVDTKIERPITAQKWTTMRGVAWLPDMSGLMIVAAEETSSTLQIWEVSYPSGQVRRITNDTVNYFGLNLAADGKTLVTTKVEAPTSIWVMPVEAGQPTNDNNAKVSIDTSKAKQVNVTNFTGTSDYEGYARLSWTPDGRIVYMSEESGNADIWSMNADGSDRKQLTTDSHYDTAATVSPDGRYIAFMSNRAGAENIWRMDIDGRNPKRLTSKLIERVPVFSADSKWIYFNSWESGKGSIWRIPVEGGQDTQVIADLSFSPSISPDGTLLLYYSPPDKEVIIRTEGGQPIKTLKALGFMYEWSSDGRALTFLQNRDNFVNLWEQPLDGGEPRQLTNFTSDEISKYAFSSDGKQLALMRTKFISDVVLISDMK
jgi:eukaryotic-like serine/threonine-protein kinase